MTFAKHDLVRRKDFNAQTVPWTVQGGPDEDGFYEVSIPGLLSFQPIMRHVDEIECFFSDRRLMRNGQSLMDIHMKFPYQKVWYVIIPGVLSMMPLSRTQDEILEFIRVTGVDSMEGGENHND